MRMSDGREAPISRPSFNAVCCQLLQEGAFEESRLRQAALRARRQDDPAMTLTLMQWVGPDAAFDVPMSLPLTGADWTHVRDLVGDVDE